MTRWALALAALVALGCGAEGATPESAEDTQPAPAVPQVALRAFEGAGDLSAVDGLAFTFVVEADGERVFSAQHRYDLRGARDRVRWTGRDGRRFDAVVDLSTRAACGTIDGAVATGADAATLAEGAYGRWINDAYWILMPHKLLDPGVELTVEEPRRRDGQRYAVLRLAFEDVGLTPGDVYFLFHDEQSGRIVRWEMQLEGQDGPPKGVSWTDYRAVGPLTLPHDHVTDDGSRHIRFEDVAVLGANNDAFHIAGCE